MHVFLSGPMGSGKSTLAGQLAARLSLTALDLDQEIERRASMSVSTIFEQHGEPAFRALEREVMQALLDAAPAVIALGGGTVTDAHLRRNLLERGVLITLDADIDELARRVGQGEGRPLLADVDARARLEALLVERGPAYAECHARVQTSGRTIAQVVDELVSVVQSPPIAVPLLERSYCVEVGPGVRHRLGERARRISASGSVLVVTDARVAPLWAEASCAELRAAGLAVSEVVIGAGEAHKTIASVQQVWDAALDAQLDRGSAIIGIGGGVVGDLAGFAASTVLRGIAVGHVPTTLLSMVDSAVGGKTGFDTRHGKNLIGTFHQPSFVLCDPEVLATLPVRERRAGLAEVIKSAWIDGERAVVQLEADAAALEAGELGALTAAIRMSAALKARIVTADEREGGLRAVLNLGHTLGHAIEAASGYEGILHGEAVALGIGLAFRVALALGVATVEQAERAARLLSAVGLPTAVEAHINPQVLGFVASDKKRRGQSLTFVVPGAPGSVVLRKLPLDHLPELLAGQAVS